MIRNQGNTTNLMISALHVITCQYIGKILMRYWVYSSDLICFEATLLLFAQIGLRNLYIINDGQHTYKKCKNRKCMA